MSNLGDAIEVIAGNHKGKRGVVIGIIERDANDPRPTHGVQFDGDELTLYLVYPQDLKKIDIQRSRSFY